MTTLVGWFWQEGDDIGWGGFGKTSFNAELPLKRFLQGLRKREEERDYT